MNKSLAKNPKERFARIEDFVTALSQAVKPIPDDETIYQSRADITKEKTANSSKKIVGLALILVILPIVAWFYFNQIENPSKGKEIASQEKTVVVGKNSTITPENNNPQRAHVKQEQLINRWISENDRGKWADTIEGLIKSAQEGDDGALIWLGYVYETGRGVDKDWRKAWNYYANAIKQGGGDKVVQRQKVLEGKANQILQDENSPQVERNKAYQLIEAVANNGHSGNNAQLWMAHRYQQGDGVTKDKTRADWWQKKYKGRM